MNYQIVRSKFNAGRAALGGAMLVAGHNAMAALPAEVTSGINDAGADLKTAAGLVIVAMIGFWALRAIGRKMGFWA